MYSPKAETIQKDPFKDAETSTDLTKPEPDRALYSACVYLPNAYFTNKISIALPSTLAVVITAKYVDGLPLYRMVVELQRSGLNISRTTLANWVIRGAQS